MHLAPDSIGAQDAVGFDRWPLAPFFIMLGFMGFFFLQKVLAPTLRLDHHHSDALVRFSRPTVGQPSRGRPTRLPPSQYCSLTEEQYAGRRLSDDEVPALVSAAHWRPWEGFGRSLSAPSCG